MNGADSKSYMTMVPMAKLCLKSTISISVVEYQSMNSATSIINFPAKNMME